MDTILEQLAAFRSICGEHEESVAIIDFVSTYLTKRGMFVERFEQDGFPSLVATTHPGRRAPKVLLAAHLDVVPAPDNLFCLTLEDGIYRGRGVFDMKFAAAAYLHTVEALRDNLASYDFGIMFTSDEENFGYYGTGMLVEKGYLPEVCILPDAAEDWNIETSAKGAWFADIHIHGKASHGSRPWEGDSASIRLIKLLHDVHTLFQDAQQPHTPTLNIGILKSGTLVNQTPHHAVAALDIRFANRTDFQRLQANVRRLCQEHDAELRTTRNATLPTSADLTNPLIAAFSNCITAETGIVPKGITSFGGSDAQFFSAHGIPCILTSPRGGNRHADSEWLDAESYEHLKPILIAYLDKVAKTTKSRSKRLTHDISALASTK